MVPVAILCAVIGTVGWGLSNAAAKRLVERFGPVRAIVFRNSLAVILLVCAVLVVGIPDTFTMRMLAFGIALSIAGYFPYISFLTGLRRGKVGIVYPIAEIWVILAALIGILYLGDVFTLGKAYALGFIVLGVIVSTVNFKLLKESDLISPSSGVPHALLSAILWGVIFAFFLYPSEALGGIFFALIVEGMVLLSALTHLMLKRERLIAHPADNDALKSMWPFLIVSSLGAGVGTMFINFGYATGEIALVSAIAGAQIVVAGMFAHFIYGERLTARQYAGALLVIVGIACAAIL